MRWVVTALLAVLGLVVCSATQGIAVKAGPAKPPLTAIACAYPDSFLTFSIYRLPLSGGSNASAAPLSYEEAINTNGVWTDAHGLTFASDLNGSIGIHTMRRGLIVADGASANNHPRWSPANTNLLAFESTREKNEAPGQQGWAAVYVYNDSDATVTRLTPPNETDFSPAWSADGEWIAVASGSGQAGASAIVVMRKDGSQRQLISPNGGWPTFDGSTAVIFHQLRGSTISGPWDIVRVPLNDTSRIEILLKGGLTPYVEGDALAYAFNDANGFRQIGLMNLTTGTTTQVTSEKTPHFNPTVTPDQGHVLYHRARPATYASPNIRRKVTDSRTPSAVTDLAVVNGDFPSLSPDGRTIAVVNSDFTNIATFSANGTGRRVVYPNNSWMTSWVNDSTIAFTGGQAFELASDGRVQVWSMSPDGSNAKKLTDNPNYNQGYPCYSPDGSKIVYRTSAPIEDVKTQANGDGAFPGEYHLNIMDADGSNSKALTLPALAQNGTGPGIPNPQIGDTHPHWGPNNTIVFASDRGHPQVMSIWTIRTDGTELTEIFNGGAFSVHPSLTKDGTGVVFTSTYAGFSTEVVSYPFAFVAQAELFYMRLDGTGLTRLTHDYGENANVWLGTQQLPESLSASGLPARQHYRDSVHPVPSTRKPKGKEREQSPSQSEDLPRPFPHGSLAIPGSVLTQRRIDDLLRSSTHDPEKKQAKSKCPFGFGR